MNRAIILHGTSANSTHNWFPWLTRELEKKGWEVWVPDLPNADHPNVHMYTPYIKENAPWPIDEKVVLIGHSSGAVEILHLLQNIPKKVKGAILAGAFKERLSTEPNWEMLKGMFLDAFDYLKIKDHAGEIVFIHSDDDPYCPIDEARELAQDLGAEFITLHGKKHFSEKLDPRFTQFPEILTVIEEKMLG
jgi:uncharacterized protein